MTSDLRTHLKQAIDAHKRERLNQARAGAGCCTSCGCDQDDKTIGCRSCHDRIRRRHYRAKAAA